MKEIYFKSVIVIAFCFLLSSSVYAASYYVATNGNDSNNGTAIGTPFLTLAKAVSVAKTSGDVIFLASGTYVTATTITMTVSGITIKGVFTTPASRPVLDFSGMAVGSSNYGIHLKANNCYFYGFMIKGAGDNGLNIEAGNDNKVEFCDFFENQDSGVQLKTGSVRNKFINCDSYYNVDPAQGNADGFADKLDEGGFNSFRGCRAYQNSDDGWDGLPKDQTYLPTDTIINSWCYKNGYLKSGAASSGNGNGFKLGGNSLIHRQIVMNCLSALNRAKGFDYNNNLGSMTLYNCTGYGNGGIGNFAFPNPVGSGEVLILKNCLSYDASYGTINSSSVQVTNSWMSPFSVSSADFQSTDATQMLLPRKADGSLPEITFMHLVTGSDLIDGGTNVGLPFNGSKPDLGCFETGTTVNTPPTVSLTAPANGSSSCQGVAITLTATTSDAGGSISKVDLYDGATLIGTITVSPYTYSWTNANAGLHSITAKATDNGGLSTTSAAISITVNAVPSAPTVSTPVTYCQNAAATALTATGTALKWYTVLTNGTSSSTAPIPSTTSIGTSSYYVSQTANGCESARATIAVAVNALPSASITAGGPTSFTQGGNVVLSANTGAGLSYKWFNGSVQVGTGSAYTANSGGNYTVEVMNASGCKVTSSTTVVTVNSNQIPLVSVTSPTNNASFTAQANVTITATASDGDGTIAKVDFYNGNTLLSTDATSPYSFAFNNLSSGTYNITAWATDNLGAIGTSSAITITVNANQPSIITINSPVNNSSVTGTSVNINVTASDSDGNITKVEYLDGNTVIGTSTTQPYSYTMNNPTAGTHVITVRVTDSNEGVTISSPTSFTVGTGTGIISSSYEAFTHVYPNPSMDTFTIKAFQEIKSLSVINMYGVEIIALQNISADQPIEIGKDLTEGTFVLLIKYASDKMEVAKLVKIK